MSGNLTVKQDNSPVARLKRVLNADSVQQQFKNALKENSGLFVASLIDLYASDQYLQNCEPNDVIMEALKAATLKLPINKSLGFAYIVPYKNNKQQKHIPTFIIGYKGYLQLAQRSGMYRFINADALYDGERYEKDRLTGEIFITGEPSSPTAEAIAYFAHLETINGFRKTEIWPRSKVEEHAKTYSQSYHSDYSPWKKHFNAMAIKTVIRSLLSKHAILCVDMERALVYDSGDTDIEIQPQKVGSIKPQVSYDTTATPPKKEPINLDERREKDNTPPPPPEPGTGFKNDQGVDTGNQDQPHAELDEFGTPLDSPMAKGAWWNMRAGDYAKGTGFAAFLGSNRQYFKTASDKAWEMIIDKYNKLYGDELPWERNGNEIGPPDEPEQDQGETDKVSDFEALMKTPAAQQLAEIAKAHPNEYKQVVNGRIPESIQQIITWMNEINNLVVEAKVNKKD